MSMIKIRSALFASLMSDRQWWQHVWKASLRFAPRCLSCAATLVGANVLIILTSSLLSGQLGKLNMTDASSVTAGADLLQLLCICVATLLALMVGLLLIAWALWKWVIKLTAFSRFLVLSGDQTMGSAEIDSGIVSALKEMEQRRWYLMKVWWVASLLLLLPAMPLSLLVVIKVLAAEPALQSNLFQIASWTGSPLYKWGEPIAAFVLTVITLQYTLMTITFSSVSDDPPGATAFAACRQSLRYALPLSVVTAVILVANTIITTPQILLSLNGGKSIADGTAAQVCLQVWFGLCSLVVWPLSVAPLCRVAGVSAEKESHV